MPKVSVIIPVYNTEKYLRKCLDSVCNQTLSDIEIICVNDCSIDNSLTILKDYALKDNRIKIIDLKENSGAGFARNRGIEQAKGEYLGFVDSDDFIDLDFYEKLYEKALETDADIIKGRLIQVGWDKPKAETYGNFVQVKRNKLLFIHTPTAIFKRKFLKQQNVTFPENLKCAEDSVFEIKVSSQCNKIDLVQEANYFYCYRDNSLNHEINVSIDKLKSIEKSLIEIINIINELNISNEEYCEAIDSRINYMSYYCSDKKSTEEVDKYVKNTEKFLISCLKRKEEFLKYNMLKRVKSNWNKQILLTKMKNLQCSKAEIDDKIKNKDFTGVTNDNNGIIVSLTSFPQRMYDIHYCLFSLLNQTFKPEKIILWLGIDKFPNKEADLPKMVKLLMLHGLTIKFVKDIGSYTKLIPALKEYSNKVIVTADDDIYYPSDWLKKLFDAHIKYPNEIICHRAHRVSFNSNGKVTPYKLWKKSIKSEDASYRNFLTGVGGVLYPKNSLYKEVLNEEKFKQIAPLADDVWFWGMSVLNKTKTRILENPYNHLIYINPARESGESGEETLASKNVSLGQNDMQINSLLQNYPQIITLINKEINNENSY